MKLWTMYVCNVCMYLLLRIPVHETEQLHSCRHIRVVSLCVRYVLIYKRITANLEVMCIRKQTFTFFSTQFSFQPCGSIYHRRQKIVWTWWVVIMCNTEGQWKWRYKICLNIFRVSCILTIVFHVCSLLWRNFGGKWQNHCYLLWITSW